MLSQSPASQTPWSGAATTKGCIKLPLCRELPCEAHLEPAKNYDAGNPASVLYIKNLAKSVVEDDFYFIFGSLFQSVEAARSNLKVDLKKDGRMRGQAFLTFPSVELAHHALNLVNGYVFKGKPIIIQFGRKSAEDRAN